FSAVPQPLLKLEAVEKSFDGVRALKPVHLNIAPGEVLGLIGENGAGKSTLIKILSGVHAPDGGLITWQGQRLKSFDSPHDALAAGIATIHQELAACGHLSVAENMLLGEPWPRRLWGGVHWKRLHEEAERRLADFELRISTRHYFNELSAAQKQEIAIARALSRQAQLLILDEPTASLSAPEVKRLFAHLQRLREAGVALLYVSHRLDEIADLTDRVVVLRDGELVATYPTVEASVERMVGDMVGRPLDQVFPRSPRGASGPVMLELKGAGCAQMFHNVSFSIRGGEVVGLAGLVGSGRSELARAIYGLYSLDEGEMRLGGKPWSPRGSQQSIRAGLVYIPEERKRQGLVLEHPVGESISIGFSDLLTHWGLIPRSAEKTRVQRALDTFAIRARSHRQPVGKLSGGNQQKTILSRWFDRDPQIIILDEPTRGVDVGAKAEIHALIDRLAARGKAVLFISSDLPEVLGMSDRVLVMHGRTICTELRGDNMTQENVILAASGLYQGAQGKSK
ncbi:MAG TPA: sugar ABC transporter ATP-binding protein, partial [Candidatus Eisenbacteria bacterium]|nr:sugar ABC transporter ATP-binding protein [Candidatus Eisenbacteria bacterium]